MVAPGGAPTSAGTLLFGGGQESRTWKQRADVWRSTDGGASWQQSTVPWQTYDRRVYTVDGGAGLVWAYANSPEHFSLDDGRSWQPVNTGPGVSLPDATAVLAGGQARGAAHGSDGYFFVWISANSVHHVFFQCVSD